jgi:segregation and condensation protein B
MSQTAPLSAFESLLFVSGEPLSFTRLGKTLSLSEKEVSELVEKLAQKYQEDAERGLMLIRDNRTVLLATKPTNASFVEALTKSALQETMSKAALEVLSIIAYRAPIARADIDAIRGVNCSFTLRNLLLRDLISREGNPSDSRGYLYRPTLRFLQVLGVEKVSELPDYETLSQDERLRMILEQEDGEALKEESLTEEQTETNSNN